MLKEEYYKYIRPEVKRTLKLTGSPVIQITVICGLMILFNRKRRTQIQHAGSAGKVICFLQIMIHNCQPSQVVFA